MKLKCFVKPIMQSVRLIIAIFCLYILFYVPDSIFGGYWGEPLPGNLAYAPGLSFHTLYLWQPYYGHSDYYNRTYLGILFYPAISLDQKYFHRPYDLGDTNETRALFANGNHIKWHPESLKEFRAREVEMATWRSECVDDREFCLQSAREFHFTIDVHFLSLLLYDAYGTNAVVKLQSLSAKETSLMTKKHIKKVVDEVEKIEQNLRN